MIRTRMPIVLAGLLCGGAVALTGCAPAAATQPAGVAGATLPERAIVLLQTQSKSEDPVMRANSIEALQPSRDPRAATVIAAGLDDQTWIVRFAAAMASGKRKDASMRATLEGLAANDPNDSVRVAAVYALRRIRAPADMNLLARTLGSADPSVRANTAFVLGQMGDASAIPLLQSHANEADPRVKFEITAALRGSASRTQQIITSLAISKFAEDQWNAMAVCPDLPPDLAANALMLGLQRPTSTPSQVEDLTTRRQLVAARSLGKMHSAQGAKVAIANLKNPNPGLRALAALALGEILVPKEESGLTPLLEDKEPVVQLAAAAAIVNIEARNAAGQ